MSEVPYTWDPELIRVTRVSNPEYVKIVFELLNAEDGYPPVRSEGLWAVPQGDGGRFLLDNIPFYAKGVSSGDVIRAASNERGELIFQEVLEASGNSTFRVYIFDESQVQSVRDDLRSIGCPSELSEVSNLIAVEVPADRPIEPFLDYIVEAEETGKLEYQEATLRHDLPS